MMPGQNTPPVRKPTPATTISTATMVMATMECQRFERSLLQSGNQPQPGVNSKGQGDGQQDQLDTDRRGYR